MESVVRVAQLHHVKLSNTLVGQLKAISKISCDEQIEYAGCIDIYSVKNKTRFLTPTCVTSKLRSAVRAEDIRTVWPSLMTFHTHTDVGRGKGFTTTLPSSADLDCYIKLYPRMQTNILCDAEGYYVIDLIESDLDYKMPVPRAVDAAMTEFRRWEAVDKCSFSLDGLEYFKTSPSEWRQLINRDLNALLHHMFGISIAYYTYDETAIVRMKKSHYNCKTGQIFIVEK